MATAHEAPARVGHVALCLWWRLEHGSLGRARLNGSFSRGVVPGDYSNSRIMQLLYFVVDDASCKLLTYLCILFVE